MSSLIGWKRRSKIHSPRAVLRIRLVGAKEGHIPLADLGDLAGGIQETVLRIARSRAERSGPGRRRSECLDQTTHESLVGRLYQLNLKSHGYRIEDDLGRSIRCDFPRDMDHLEEIRELVGRRIVLTGTAYRDEDGDIQRFEVEEIRAADGAWPEGEFFSFDIAAALSAVKPIGDPSSLRIDDLTESEAEIFWQAIDG